MSGESSVSSDELLALILSLYRGDSVTIYFDCGSYRLVKKVYV